MQETPPQPATPQDRRGPFSRTFAAIRRRIISGLVLALPIAITFWILYWLYTTFQQVVLRPLAATVRWLIGEDVDVRLPLWWERLAEPVLAIVLILAVLYFLGLFFRSRLHRLINWTLLHVPVVTVIYKTVSQVFESLDPQGSGSSFKRVVLVEFPHPGTKALAFVTNTLQDSRTGRPILCVCVLTGVLPPAGFTLFVPEDRVTDVDWSVHQTIQAILSGGITAPAVIAYFDASHEPIAAGPIVDPAGKPVGTRADAM